MTIGRSAAARGVGLLALVGLLYGLTLYPGLGGRVNAGDSAKFQYIGRSLGVPHEPGYPQYVVLNHLWTRLPLGLELATQVNLLSLVLALAAGGFLFSALRRLAGSDLAAALGTATALLSRSVWTFATEAEVHALHLLYVAAILWAVERWRARGSSGWRVALVALAAAGLGNHPLMIALLPGLALVLLGADWRAAVQPRFLIVALSAALLGAAQYGYLLWRAHSDAPVVEGIARGADLSDLMLSMSGFRFADRLLDGARTGPGARLAETLAAAARQLPTVCLLLAPVGIAALWRRDRLLAGFVVTGLAANLAWIVAYRIGDWQPYLGPLWCFTVAAAAVGLGAARPAPRWRAAAAALWTAHLAALVWWGFGQLAVPASPFDRRELIEVAGPGTVVLAYPGESYRDTQFVRYYRHGLGAEERLGLEVATAREALAVSWRFLEERPLVFSDPRVRAMADERRIEYRAVVQAGRSPRTVFVSGTEWPVEVLEAVPEAAGLTLRRPGGPALAVAGEAFQAVVVAGSDGRVKGAMSWPLATAPERRRAMAEAAVFLGRIPDGDYVCIVLQAAAASLDRDPGLRAVAHELLGLPPAVGAARVVLLAGRSGALELFVDPRSTVELRVGV